MSLEESPMTSMKYGLTLAVLIGLAGSASNALAAGDAVPPEVQALYERTCSEWSQQSWIAPDGRNAFYQNCMKDIADAIPSGYEESDD